MHRTIVGGMVASALAFMPAAGVLAQDAATEAEIVRHPSHVHVGLCPTPGDIVAPLSDVTAIVGEATRPGAGTPVESASTTIGLALTDMLASEHAVVVHQAHEDMATLIACGDIAGPLVSGTDLVIGLGAVGGSGYSGIAMLTDDGDGTTTVDVFITHSAMSSVAPAASGSPDPERPASY